MRAGHRGDIGAARALLDDPDGSVRASALGALARAGALTAHELATTLDDPDPEVRRRACDVAGRDMGFDLEVLALALVARLADRDPLVVVAAAAALGEHPSAAVATAGAVEALSHTTRSHGDPRCREAAVAALGAVGDPAGLGAVLAALDDKAAVRRRAAVALAAFDGPDAEAGLARCAEDRDWQVRQVAEDLRR
ncbi:MAG: HEAT repeat domain-containing protein [Acidimicrobiales bacterium]